MTIPDDRRRPFRVRRLVSGVLVTGVVLAGAAFTAAGSTAVTDAGTAAVTAADVTPSPGPVGPSPSPATGARALTGPAAELAALTGSLEADRLLLVELRKDLPSTRSEAESYLARVEELALTSDPARLGVIVSRLRAAAPVFLDWRDKQFASQQEANTAFLESGAAAFDATWSSLHDAVLLTVANRIDTIIDLVDALQGGR